MCLETKCNRQTRIQLLKLLKSHDRRYLQADKATTKKQLLEQVEHARYQDYDFVQDKE